MSYAVDEVKYTEDIAGWIDANMQGGKLHLLEGKNSDSGLMAKVRRPTVRGCEPSVCAM